MLIHSVCFLVRMKFHRLNNVASFSKYLKTDPVFSWEFHATDSILHASVDISTPSKPPVPHPFHKSRISFPSRVRPFTSAYSGLSYGLIPIQAHPHLSFGSMPTSAYNSGRLNVPCGSASYWIVRLKRCTAADDLEMNGPRLNQREMHMVEGPNHPLYWIWLPNMA